MCIRKGNLDEEAMGKNMQEDSDKQKGSKRVLLLINCLLVCIGLTGGPLITRLYFVHGGHRVWLYSWLQTAGFPVLLLPQIISYVRTRKPFFSLDSRLFLSSAVIGVFMGVDDYLYAYGLARLPASTSSLIVSTQLAFTAVFAFLLVRQKFTPFSINAIVLLTVGAGVLALHSSGDRPAGVSPKQYVLGFVMTLAAAALYSFLMPLLELMYGKSKQPVTYSLVVQVQLVISFTATLFCTVGMLVNNDFKVMGREAREFGVGETKYYVVAVCTAITWQIFFLGSAGVIFCASSFLLGILIAVLLPVTQVLAVIFFREKFTAEKGVSLVLSLWGFVSYFYGEYNKQLQKKKQNNPNPHESELLPSLPNNSL
ncbi:purine permease 1-like [Neltuma alba]|uniref:purine permease 1-like n=1 Tax=Neltuma alba TaxID=207710 RepID=UPI0010A4EA86|nr:purine permease 1-like [Prosopis alba]